MHEHELPFIHHDADELVALAEAGETVELLRFGTTVAVIIGVDEYNEMVAELERLGRARAFLATVVPAQ